MHTENVLTPVIDFSSDEEKRVLAAVVELGIDEDKAKEWLAKWLLIKDPYLNHETPCSLLGTEEGICRVIHLIGARFHGVFL